MKLAKHFVKNSALATTVAALIFGIACSSAQAGKPASDRLPHANNPIYLQQQKPSPSTTPRYEPLGSPGFHEDFGS